MGKAALVWMLAALAAAQETPQGKPEQSREGLEWAVALAGRFRNLHNPVVSGYALGQLAAGVCARDQVAGSGLYREALVRLNTLPDHVFSDPGPVLPVSSFSGMWKFLRAGALKCDPAVTGYVTADRIRTRIAEERLKANSNLDTALDIVEPEPDRATQLADAAMAASDPDALHIDTLSKFLSRLRDRAPDLSDDLFPRALDFVTSPESPRLDQLLELGNYLFTHPKLVDSLDSDKKELSAVLSIAGSQIANFMATRTSASSDDIELFIRSSLPILARTDNPNYDPVIAYAIGYQLLAKARESFGEYVEPLEKVLAQIEGRAGAAAGQVQSSLEDALRPDGAFIQELRMAADLAIDRAFSEARANRFQEARRLLTRVEDATVAAEVRALVDFTEAADAISRRDLPRATYLTGSLRPGVKRSLLYAGIIHASSHDEAIELLKLALRDAELLPAEQRISVCSALGASTMHVDAEWALTVLNQVVASSNDASRRPHRGRYDPKSLRAIYSPGTDRSTDSAIIVFSSRGAYEVIDSGLARHQFSLRVPGVSLLTLPGLVGNAAAIDFKRLEAAVLELRDETRLAAALNALAAMRLK